MPDTTTGRRQHAGILLLFSLVTIAWLWPILSTPGARLPGPSAGDNFLFVWNLWWTRHSLLAGGSPFRCPLLFVPYGVNLTLNTHTLLPTTVAGLIDPHGSLIAATNAIIAVHLWLNFVTAYALAYRVTRDVAAATIAALLFGWSPYIDQRLLGHFNLIAAWTLPLAALMALLTLERSGPGWPILLGFVMGAIAYVEYYYAVYATALIAAIAVQQATAVARGTGPTPRWRRRLFWILGVLSGIALLAAVAIGMTGGTVLRIGPIVVSVRSARNPIAAAGLLMLVAAVIALMAEMRATVDLRKLFENLRRLMPAALLAAVCALPLLVGGVALWLHGDYVSQRYLWRSAPAGIDLGTLLLGNPRGLLWAGIPLTPYTRLHIDGIEQTAWFAPGALCLCVAAWWLRRGDRQVARWTTLGALFLIWAMGPYAVAFGHHLPILLPATLIRYVPVIANARIPGRTIIVVYLSVALLAAVGFRALCERRRSGVALICAIAALADLIPAAPLTMSVDHPAIFDVLRTRPESGAVCELPLGLRDSFGETGRFDSTVLWHQTLHQRAMAGGFVSRLPPRIVQGYLSAPILGSFLRLSAGQPVSQEPVPDRRAAADALLSREIRFVLLDRVSSPPGLVAYVDSLKLQVVAQDARRQLLLVEQ